MTEDEMVGWHHRLDGCEFEQGDGEGQGRLACCRPWDCKESDMTEQLNNNGNTPSSLSLALPGSSFHIMSMHSFSSVLTGPFS